MSFIDGFKKMNKAIDRKIKRIQRSDESTKKKWLVGGSIVMMIFIVFMWVGYLNLTLPQVAPAEEVQEEQTSFLQAVSNGASILYTKVERSTNSLIKSAEELFEKKREFEFSN